MFKMKPYIDDLSYLKDGRLALLAHLHQSPRQSFTPVNDIAYVIESNGLFYSV